MLLYKPLLLGSPDAVRFFYYIFRVISHGLLSLMHVISSFMMSSNIVGLCLIHVTCSSNSET